MITGSDGRDDLILQNQDGTEFIQEDEQQFLLRVKKKVKENFLLLHKELSKQVHLWMTFRFCVFHSMKLI